MQTNAWPLVGREAELQLVANAIGSADRGGIVLAGAAGVGKTRLGSECMTVAEKVGFATSRVVATRAASSIPFGPLAPLLPVRRSRVPRRVDMLREAVETISAVGEGKPLLLVVDDAHLLDDASAAVVHQLALDGRAFLVVAVRNGEAAPDAIVALWKEGLAERVEITPLSRPDIESLVVTALGASVSGSTTHALWRASEGNALMLREIILGALSAGFLQCDSDVWHLTGQWSRAPRLVELVEARLADLTAAQRSVVEVVALGEPLGVALLDELSSRDDVEVLESRGLLDGYTEAGELRIRLAHPLYGDVLREGLSPLRALQVNRALADAAEAQGPSRWEESLRAAVWRLDGGGTARPDLMIDAARQAYAAHDNRLAERLARAVVGTERDAEAELLLADLLEEQGRHEDAEALYARIEREALDDASRSMAASGRAIALFWGLARPQDASRVLDETRARVTDEVWRDELAAQQATFELLVGHPREAIDLSRPMLEHAAGRPFVVAAIAAAPALAISGNSSEAIAVADRGLDAHLRLGDQLVFSDPGIHVMARILALGEAGRLEEAHSTAQAVYDASITVRSVIGQAWSALLFGRISLLEGRLAAAARWFTEGAVLYRELDEVGPMRWCIAGRVLAAAMSGDASLAASVLAELDRSPPTPMQMMEPDVDRARAWADVVGGDLRAARGRLTQAAATAGGVGAFALEAGAWHDLARLGAAKAAVARLDELALIVEGPLTAARASHARALARADGEAAELSADAFESIGALLFAAEAAAGAADCHRAAGAARRADRCAHRSASLAERCEGARTPALLMAGPLRLLSPREREVANLAVDGLATKAIATRLSVSVRTVENHLQRVYEKLGVSSRLELAEALRTSE